MQSKRQFTQTDLDQLHFPEFQNPLSIWDDFRRVDAMNEEALRGFCVRWHFRLRTPAGPFDPIPKPGAPPRYIRQWQEVFHFWQDDFRQKVIPAGRRFLSAAAALSEKHSTKLMDEAYSAGLTLANASLMYLKHLSLFVAVSAEGIPQLELMSVARAESHEIVMTVGHIYYHFLREVWQSYEDRTPFLKCSACGYPFRANWHQVLHQKQKHKVFCLTCQMDPTGSPGRRNYMRIYMRRYRKFGAKRKR